MFYIANCLKIASNYKNCLFDLKEARVFVEIENSFSMNISKK